MTDRPDERARLAIIWQRIAPDLAALLWRVRNLRELPTAWREEVANVLGCEAAAHGLDKDEVPNAYGRELGEWACPDSVDTRVRLLASPRGDVRRQRD